MAKMPVVAGVDGSEESLRAVEWAALEAQRHRAPLRRGRVARRHAGRRPLLELVVIGRHDASGSHPAIGGIQHALLNHGRGPIAIVPATVDTAASTSHLQEPRPRGVTLTSLWPPATPAASRNFSSVMSTATTGRTSPNRGPLAPAQLGLSS